jgi:hypothetical protein
MSLPSGPSRNEATFAAGNSYDRLWLLCSTTFPCSSFLLAVAGEISWAVGLEVFGAEEEVPVGLEALEVDETVSWPVGSGAFEPEEVDGPTDMMDKC